MAKTLDNTGIGVSQQLVNTESTIIRHPDSVEQEQNGYDLGTAEDTANQKISQQITKDKGEREGVEASPPNGVLHSFHARGARWGGNWGLFFSHS